MTKKSNLSLRFTRVWEKHCLKTAAATLLLCCALPVQAKADTYKTQETASIQQQTVKTTGVIIDNTGEPLIGVSVKVQGTNTGTITDLDGKFSIDTPPKALLEFSFIGYKTITMEVTGKELHITMQEDSKQLDEVVVVGYGSQKKVNVTGSVSMVNADVLESRPVQNVSQALQGVIPGLNMSVGSSGGTLDGKLNVNIRGAGTISDGSSSSPLVLIDGIEGDMNTVNPNDIESVSVLKDAASSSIYGARAAFGVILITTKSGKSG